MNRVVIDTNVLISSTLSPNGNGGVILQSDDKPENDVSSERHSLLDLAGIFRGCKNMDVKEIRAERRNKYENSD